MLGQGVATIHFLQVDLSKDLEPQHMRVSLWQRLEICTSTPLPRWHFHIAEIAVQILRP